MNSMIVKRQAYSILLMLAFVLPLLVGLGLLHYQRMHLRTSLKQRMLQSMDKQQLLLLSFTAEESLAALEWEHDDEFEYEGEMYDVVYREERGNRFLYWCWADKEETALNRKISALSIELLQAEPLHEHQTCQLRFFLEQLYCSGVSVESWGFYVAVAEEYPCVRKVFYYHASMAPPTPPPLV